MTVSNFLTNITAALTNSRRTNPLIIDISSHQRVNWDIVAPHIDGVIARCSWQVYKDVTFLPAVEECAKRGIPIEAYHGWSPNFTNEQQMSVIRSQLSGTGIPRIWNDVEVWKDAAGGTIAGATISSRAQAFTLPQHPVGGAGCQSG